MSGKARSFVGSVLTIVGYAITPYTGWGYALVVLGSALAYDGARRIQKEAERRARAGSRSGPINGNIRGSYEHHMLVFGKSRVGGIIAALGTHTPVSPDLPNQDLYVGIEHSISHAGGCEGITNIWIDDVLVTAAQLSADPNSTEAEVNLAQFNPLVRLRSYRGTGTQAADTTLVANSIEASTAYRRGIAWTWARFRRTLDDEKFRKAFKFGIPNFNVELKGIRCYDPRYDSTQPGGSGTQSLSDPTTWTWTDNPILHASTYSVMLVSDGGMGTPSARIDWTSVSTAASVCEEQKSILPSGTRNRYSGNGVLSTADIRDVNLQKLLDACMGRRVRVGGLFKFYAGEYRTPTVAIDETWLAGAFKVTTLDPLESLYNAVRVNFNDASQDYKTIDAPPFTNSTYETADGGHRVWQDINLPMVSNTYDAQYIAQMLGKRSRYQMTVELMCNLKALDVEVWETCTVSLPEVSLAGRVFRIESWTFTQSGIALTLKEDHSSIYTVSGLVVPNTGSAATVGSETPSAPTTVTATGVSDGISLQFTPPPAFTYEEVQVERSTTSGGALTIVGRVPNRGTTFNDPVTTGTEYFYKLRARTKTGTLGAYSSEGTATAKTVAAGATVGAKLGTNLVQSDGTTVVSNVDQVPDGATYVRVKGTAATNGEVDMSKGGVINRTGDNIAESATRKWAAESGADVTSGKSITVLADVATTGRFYTFTQTFTTGTSATVAIPTGAGTLTIRAWGGGGSGRASVGGTPKGGGGGGGSKKVVGILSTDWGSSITYSVGAAGAAVAATNNGNAGGASTVTSSGLSFTNINISAGGGGGGTTSVGAGGTATGGDTNISGSNGNPAGDGGASGVIDGISGAGGGSGGGIGKRPGGGGGMNDSGASSGAGAVGMVTFTWTG